MALSFILAYNNRLRLCFGCVRSHGINLRAELLICLSKEESQIKFGSGFWRAQSYLKVKELVEKEARTF